MTASLEYIRKCAQFATNELDEFYTTTTPDSLDEDFASVFHGEFGKSGFRHAVLLMLENRFWEALKVLMDIECARRNIRTGMKGKALTLRSLISICEEGVKLFPPPPPPEPEVLEPVLEPEVEPATDTDPASLLPFDDSEPALPPFNDELPKLDDFEPGDSVVPVED